MNLGLNQNLMFSLLFLHLLWSENVKIPEVSKRLKKLPPKNQKQLKKINSRIQLHKRLNQTL